MFVAGIVAAVSPRWAGRPMAWRITLAASPMGTAVERAACVSRSGDESIRDATGAPAAEQITRTAANAEIMSMGSDTHIQERF
jgi:hypothetical protein